ncbi:uncharacterized protein LOC131890532 [Tigriopus californicus]|uniref:uncharacterized protein LOC131890532 n=1 Tax=Tigriopus californicus TaxID=6832 RepID=UPI0027DA0136|nr:uncharacterized protein LOC131890532 [Tigriopus californicus]
MGVTSMAETSESICSVLVMACFLTGVIVNTFCLIKLRRRRSVFHRFLKILAAFDLMVVFCCLWMYSLPVVWHQFAHLVFLPSVSFVLPLVQMSLMGSVYSTVVMSLERYLRLCRIQIMSTKRANICLGFVVIFPLVFYSPKFFEYRYHSFTHESIHNVNCSEYVEELERWKLLKHIEWDQVSSLARTKFTRRISIEIPSIDPEDRNVPLPNRSIVPNLGVGPPECSNFVFDVGNDNETFIRKFKVLEDLSYPNTTALRRNPVYYQLYCVVLNTFFASLFPLLALIFLNIQTLMALREIGRQVENQDKSFLTRTSPGPMEDDTLSKSRERSTTSHYRCHNIEGGSPSLAIRYHQSQVEIVRRHRSRDSINSYENLMRKRESRLTRISLSIVWLFIFCHIWKLVPTLYELIYSESGTELSTWPDWLVVVKDLSHTLIAFNSAVNFLIYTCQ